ncbi:MAG: hypothetical protein L0154_24835 [Chloroflexi bacterium]|nr:hypothetical protein [Chloroflexota bacterium]
MDDQPLTPEELALIERLRNMPQPELRPAAVEKIQQQLFQELELMTAASSAAASTTSILSLPKILLITVVIVVIIVVSISLQPPENDSGDAQNPTNETLPSATQPPTVTPGFTAEPTTETLPATPVDEDVTATATPTPENKCGGGSEDWDCSSVEVEGTCINSNGVDTASFIVTNTGDPAGGDMDGPVEFRLYVNGTLLETGTLQIPGGDSATITYEGELNDVVRLEVDQRPGHPGQGSPNAEVILDCDSGPMLVIEGPVSEINLNIITIFDIDIELAPDDPLLLQLKIGDIVRVQGSADFEGNVLVIAVMNIFVIEYDTIIFVNLPAGCKLTGFGNGHIRCKGDHSPPPGR